MLRLKADEVCLDWYGSSSGSGSHALSLYCHINIHINLCVIAGASACQTKRLHTTAKLKDYILLRAVRHTSSCICRLMICLVRLSLLSVKCKMFDTPLTFRFTVHIFLSSVP